MEQQNVMERKQMILELEALTAPIREQAEGLRELLRLLLTVLEYAESDYCYAVLLMEQVAEKQCGLVNELCRVLYGTEYD